MLEVFPIPAFKDNYIWCFIQNEKAWVVDPGDATPVFQMLEKKSLILEGIFLTHHHSDHSGGIDQLKQRIKNLKVYGSHRSPLSSLTHKVREDNEVNHFKVKEIPGHTLDHIAFYDNNHLFCGDTLFSVGCGKVFEGSNVQMYQSLMKLNALPENIKIYCGHEYTLSNLNFALHLQPENITILQKIEIVKNQLSNFLPSLPSTLKEERTLNPFLRCEDKVIHAIAENKAKKKLIHPAEVFSVLREWKNQYV